MVFSPDGLHVATASLDGFVKFYELGREDQIEPRLVPLIPFATLCRIISVLGGAVVLLEECQQFFYWSIIIPEMCYLS